MTPTGYKEQDFEAHIADALVSSGYRLLPPAAYDRELVLLPDELIGFLKDTQPDEYDRLHSQYGAATDRNICLRISKEIAKHGTLHVLRKGVKDRGVKLRLVYFRPSSDLNPEHLARYRKNRFAVVRQLMYSAHTNDELDLALFVNGIPVVTAELKNSLTGQFVGNAVKQYKQDRDPKEPLFHFGRALVHFAVGNEEAFFTTRLAGERTRFFPFNRGTADGGAGNPVNPTGHATAYLWEDVWRPDTLLDLLGNYLHIQVTSERVYDPKKGEIVDEESRALIFPRYHQLDVVRKLVSAAAEEGAGHSYLVQHSAGSGKSNSIAWLSHQLRQLHDADGERLFDTIVVVTDRRVLDQQLQGTIKQFEQTAGTVVPITKTSAQLREALEQGKDIVITTLQKFPVIAQGMTALKGQRFAVVIDEAHSSQSGESARALTKTLTAPLEEAEAEDEEEPDLEDVVAAEVRQTGRQEHISWFAFTATPKDKTLELFGRKNADGKPVPFHTYTMRQAIEEGFILDVLRNYATFKRYFKLVKSAEGDEEYDESKAVRALTSYVDLTDHAIERKARICLEHFQNVTARGDPGTRPRHARHPQPAARGALLPEAADADAGAGARLRPAGRLLRHRARSGQRRGAHGELAEPAPVEDEHPGCVQASRVPHLGGREQVPDRLRRAPAAHDVRGQEAGRRGGGADALTAQPDPAGEDGDGGARLRERGGGDPGGVPALLPAHAPGRGDRPEQALRPDDAALRSSRSTPSRTWRSSRRSTGTRSSRPSCSSRSWTARCTPGAAGKRRSARISAPRCSPSCGSTATSPSSSTSSTPSWRRSTSSPAT